MKNIYILQDIINIFGENYFIPLYQLENCEKNTRRCDYAIAFEKKSIVFYNLKSEKIYKTPLDKVIYRDDGYCDIKFIHCNNVYHRLILENVSEYDRNHNNVEHKYYFRYYVQGHSMGILVVPNIYDDRFNTSMQEKDFNKFEYFNKYSRMCSIL